MKTSQLNRGQPVRLMYIENRDGLIDGEHARIGCVRFSKSGRTLYYRGRSFFATGGRGIRGNFLDAATREEYWISGIKKRGGNHHPAERGLTPVIDEDGREAYLRIKQR